MKYAIVHISDIHYRKNEPEGVSTVLKAFINDLNNQKSMLKEYSFFIAITGDIVYAGKDTEAYYYFSNELDEDLNNIGLSKERRFIVPGNHDVDQDIVKKKLSELKKVTYTYNKSERKFNDFITENEIFDGKFDNYMLFESDFAKYGINYSSIGKGWEIDSNLGVYCLNSAITSFGGVDKIKDEKELSIGTRYLVEWCNKKNTTINILLIHHPIDYLTKWSKDELKTIIENNFILCLSGHNHEKDISYNTFSQNAVICSAPQLYTKKNETLGYSIILINDNTIEKIIYRQYVQNSFLNGSVFSGNNEGIVYPPKNYSKYIENKNIERLKRNLSNSLVSFNNQPEIFIEPNISKTREFTDDSNMLQYLIREPYSSIILAQPQFGLTSLSHYIRLEAYKKGSFWIYVDAAHTKARNILKEIKNQIEDFEKKRDDIKCIIIDSWNESIIDHQNILKILDKEFENVPILLMIGYWGFVYNSDFSFNNLKHSFNTLHLQALRREKVREFVSKYNKIKNIAREDVLVSKIVKDLEVLNIHRTPLNCFTLLKVFEKDFNENMINRTKMIKSVLFILFTDIGTFTYSSKKPDVDDVEFLLGGFCKELVKKGTTKFRKNELISWLKKCAEENLITVNVETIINTLESNNILLRYDDYMEFRHSFWIYYFAGTYMFKDDKFKEYILSDRNYVNYPEIIEFYTGIDGKRENAIKTLFKETTELTKIVNSKIGIPDEFNPFDDIIWNPTEESINLIREEISKKVQDSNLPSTIKDHHADMNYNSEAPYDQTINSFLNEFSVVSLLQSIKASSRALRNSNYISPELKLQMFKSILMGWEQISRVIFWLSPALADNGRVSYDGFGLILDDGFTGTFIEKLKKIYLANPLNVVNYLKDDISSNKIGAIFYKNLYNNDSRLQKHFITLFLIKERPDGWYKHVFNYMNLLHVNSFYLRDLYDTISYEIKNGFLDHNEIKHLKNLLLILHAKIKYTHKGKIKDIPKNMLVNNKNALPIDKILASSKNDRYIK